MTGSLGNIMVKESHEKRHNIYLLLQTAGYMGACVIPSVFFVIIQDLIRVWLGDSFLLDDFTIICITVNLYLSCALTPFKVFMDAGALYIKSKYITFAGAIINIFLSIILGKKVGIGGIILASAIAKLSTYIWYEPIVLFRDAFNRRPNKFYSSFIVNGMIVFFVCAIEFMIGKQIIVTNWWSLFLKTLIIGSMSCIMALLFYLKSKGFKLLVQKIRSMRK